MKTENESGIALITVLLILVLMGALLFTFTVKIQNSQKMLGMDMSSDRAFSGAYAALERITQEMANMLRTDTLNDAAIRRLEEAAINITNQMGKDNGAGETEMVDHEGNVITIRNPQITVSDTTTRKIIKGAFEGLLANIATYTISVTAKAKTGEEITLEREVQVVLIPVFQFGVFSDSSLAFFPGNRFNFGGRVHTNEDLYLGHGYAEGLWMSDYVTAHGLIRTQTRNNGTSWSGDHNVRITTRKDPTQDSHYRRLTQNEGNEDNSNNTYRNNPAGWKTNVSDKYNGFLNNGNTGAFRLDLPVAGNEATQPIDIIRRGVNGEPKELAEQRYFTMASIRILLSDTVNDITSLPEWSGGTPVALAGQFLGTPNYNFAAAGTNANYRVESGAPLIGGYILIERRKPDALDGSHVWENVTNEILSKGITGSGMSGECSSQASSGAIIRLQRFADATTGNGCNVQTSTNLWPNALFDSREGSSTNGAPTALTLNGVMHYVELDIKNLTGWLKGQIETGNVIDIISDNELKSSRGYVVYFSDRRGSTRVNGRDTAEYNYESVADNSGGWDLNGDGVTQAKTPRPSPIRTVTVGASTYNSTLRTTEATWNALHPMHAVDTNETSRTSSANIAAAAEVAKRTRPVFFRRALKLVNGSIIDLGTNTDTGLPFGLSIASENPTYIQGNYNYNFTGTPPNSDPSNDTAESNFKRSPIGNGSNSVGAAVIADAVTILSNNWTDRRSFGHPTSGNTLTLASSNRAPSPTFYRLAIISGKNNTYPVGGSGSDWGTDGGLHNFLRILEEWSATNNVFYRGSLISMFYSRQAMSAFKTGVYNVPKRRFSYENGFIENIATLPPRTPMVRYIDVLSFTRVTGKNRW